MSVISTVVASFTRPADTTAYASGDLVANSTTAGSVVPLTFELAQLSNGGMVRRCRLVKSGAVLTNASFRVHIYAGGNITCANGDNGAWSTDRAAFYLGSFDITMDKAFTDGAMGIGVPNAGTEINFGRTTYYGLIEARSAYTPASSEVFSVDLEVIKG